jgi:hypothetical protein
MEKITPGHSVYRVYDTNKNEVLKTGDRLEAFEKGLQILFSEGKVEIHQGPGLLCDWNLERNLDPEGGWHHDRIPLDLWYALKDDVKEKLKK